MTQIQTTARREPPVADPRGENPAKDENLLALRMPKYVKAEFDKEKGKEPEKREPNRDTQVEDALKNMPAKTAKVKWLIDDGKCDHTLIVIREAPWKADAKPADNRTAVRVQDQVKDVLAYLGKQDLKVETIMLSTPRTKEISDKIETIKKLTRFAQAMEKDSGVEDLATAKKYLKNATDSLETATEEAKKAKKPIPEDTKKFIDAEIRQGKMIVSFYEALDSLDAERKRDAVVGLAAAKKVNIADFDKVPKGDTIADRVTSDRGYAFLVVDGSRDVTKEITKWNKDNPTKRIHLVEVTPTQYPDKK